MTALEEQVAALQILRDGERHFDALIRLGEAVVPLLEQALRRPSSLFEPRLRVVRALSAIPSERAAEALERAFLAALNGYDALDPVQREAEHVVLDHLARALSRRRPDCAPLLRAALRRHPLVGCIEALAERRDLLAIPLFVEALRDDFAREAAVAALDALGSPVVPALIRELLLGPSNPSGQSGRAAAAALLGKLGGPEAELPLLWCLADDAHPVRVACALALYRRQGAGAAQVLWPALVEAMSTGDVAEEEEVVAVLSNLPPPSEEVLARLAQSGGANRRGLSNLARVLVRHPDAAHTDSLRFVLRRLDPEGQLALLEPLLRFNAYALLRSLFAEASPQTQVQVLRRARGTRALPALLPLAATSPSPRVRREARRARGFRWPWATLPHPAER